MDLRSLVIKSARKAPSTPDSVVEAMREAISMGCFQDGQPLPQEDLAAHLGVSKIPLREAFRRLEAEGLITLLPNRGAVVATLSAPEAQEIMEIRVALETLALSLAIPKIHPRVLRRAREVLADLEEETDIAKWGRLNWQFHFELYAPAERPHLMDMIRVQHSRVDRYMRIVLSTLGYQPRSQEEHRELLAACERVDIPQAVSILTRHVQTAGELVCAHLRKQPVAGP